MYARATSRASKLRILMAFVHTEERLYTRNVFVFKHFWHFSTFLKADLDGTTFAHDQSRAISGERAARVMQNIAHNSRHSTLPIPIPRFNLHETIRVVGLS